MRGEPRKRNGKREESTAGVVVGSVVKRRHWRDGHGKLVVHAAGGQEAPSPATAPVTVPVTVPLELATSYRARTRGLLGRDRIDGAMLLSPANSVHTFGMRIPIDVAYLDRHLRVLTVRTMPPGRLGLPRLRSRHVLEAEAGAMEAWGLRAGARVEVVTGV
ncbi:DUF192 domain-containing protein [Streptomyces thermoviolaceus]|mgnify:CR=1 FL=1|uniref:DUF192 domain-containing protein n=1 Tax=Streptomyces thermoviolaceus subsp. thermoviolaceus TaxID=66860 RepID=A0ABX0YVK8_STRTL|nr:DUF192 domain-containing protein [Streptomyces thermoviolaceus]NJP15944.1 DUF192 domain-containing protein [Streptomyces thermoviolaceus subsp. thermoviolaceus]WTD47660.1 DUF192 domain-containing protein [Streptomyces thermoviolaceus]